MFQKKWFTYLFRILFVLVFGTLMLGIIYEQVGRFKAQYKYSAPGAFAELPDYDLHYVRAGNGGPTVVFVAGLGGDHTVWKSVQESISDQTTTLSYDRSRILWSGISFTPKDAETISQELHDLLASIQAPKPYILVGHSLAGCSLRPFIRDHGSDIAGLVFVDVSHPEQNERGSEDLQEKMKNSLPNIASLRFATGFGPLRIFMNKNPYYTELPNDDPKNVAYRQNYFRSVDGLIAEIKGVPAVFQQAKEITSFGSIPLTVISAQKEDYAKYLQDSELGTEMQDLWNQLQIELTGLSTNSKRILATESGHMVTLDQPEIIVEAIIEQLGGLDKQ